MKSLRLTIITAAVALISIGQPISFGFLKSSPNGTLVYAAEKESIDNSEIANIVKKITVRIEGVTQGSGVIVKKEGNRYTVLTAWHVVKDNRPVEEVGIITSDGKEHLWDPKSLQRLGKVDMAVITFTSKNKYKVAIIGDSKKIKYQDQVYVAGFPLFDKRNLKLESGEVIANADVSIDQGYQFLYTNQTKKGMSGGVVLNKNGELIGLHGRGEIDRKKKEEAVIRKTGINQGVPISFYKKYLNGLPVLVSKKNSTTADDYLAKAAGSLNMKGIDQTTIRLTNAAIKIRPDAEGYFLRAFAKSNMNDHIGAILDLDKVTEINPNDIDAFYNRGNSKMALGDFKGAISDFSLSIKNDPKDFDSYYNMGISKFNLGDLEGSIKANNNAIKIKEDFWEAYINLGVSKKLLEDYKGAIADLKKAIKINPESSSDSAFFNLGQIYNLQNNYKEAIKKYNKAIKLNPSDSEYYYNRGIVNQNLYRKKAAINDYDKAIKLNPYDPKYYYNRGIAKRQTNDPRGAIFDYNRLLELDNKYPELDNVYNNRGNARRDIGDFKAAIDDYKKAITINPEFALGYYNLGTIQSKTGELKVGIKSLDKAIKISPKDSYIYIDRALLRDEIEDTQGYCSDLIKASELGAGEITKYLNNSGKWCWDFTNNKEKHSD